MSFKRILLIEKKDLNLFAIKVKPRFFKFG
jgi:hypothetical protein